MDARVLGLVVATCLATGLACGLVPALQVSKTNVNDRLKDGGRAGGGAGGSHRWTTGLLTAEVALTLILLAGAGLMGRSFLALQAETSVVDAAGLTTMGIRLSSARYPTTEERRLFYGEVEDRLAAMREVERAVRVAVLSRRRSRRPVDPVDEPERHRTGTAVVDHRRCVLTKLPNGSAITFFLLVHCGISNALSC